MSDEYGHIAPDFRHLMKLDDRKRIESLYEEIWIGYPRTKLLFQHLDSLLLRPKKARIQSAVIIGESNMGKTTLIRHYAKLHPSEVQKDQDGKYIPSIPVLIVEAPSIATERGFFTAIIEALGMSTRPTDNVAKLQFQMMTLMKSCNVRMLIIDEFHNLKAATPTKLETILNTLKSMSNSLSIPIIAVGTDSVLPIFKRDKQISSRFQILKLNKWTDRKEITGLLRQFESRLPLKKPSNLTLKENKDKADLLISVSKGNLGSLHELLIECSKEAINSGTEQITLDIIKKFNLKNTLEF